MTAAIVTAIEERRADLQRELALLDQLDATIAQYDDGASPPEPEPEPAPAPPAAASRAKRAASPTYAPPPPSGGGPAAAAQELERKITSALLTHPSGLSKAMLLEKTKASPSALKSALTRMVDAGKVTRQGATKSLRYKLIRREPTGKMSERIEASKVSNSEEETRRARAIALRDKVTKAVAADPDSLTDERLAMALNVPLQNIVDATEKLVSDHRLAIAADSTYSLAQNGRASLAGV